MFFFAWIAVVRYDQPQISEEQTEYYADLVVAVSSLHDPRSIVSLVGAVLTGNVAMNALASFGDTAVDPLIRQLTLYRDLIENRTRQENNP